MPTLHVLCKKESLDASRLQGKVVIVLDVLFASSTVVHAFSTGVECIWPARDAEDARHIAQGLSGEGADTPMLAGEYRADSLPGFGPATPLALERSGTRSTTLVYATTNGTVALRDAAGADDVYVGALLNGRALADHVLRAHPQASVLLVCAGSFDHFNLEDFYGAGHLVAHLERSGNYALTDAARAALLLRRGCDARSALGASRVGQMMDAHHLQHEVDYAAQTDVLDIVPRLDDGCLRLVAA